jgi:hypothetical protein
MSKQMGSTTSRFTRQFLLVELASSTIPNRLTSDVLREGVKVVPHIRGQCPLPLGGATSVGASGVWCRAPCGGRGGATGRGQLRVRVAIAIGLGGIVFIIGNEATVMKIVVDGSKTSHEVCWVRCGGADEAGAPYSRAQAAQGAGSSARSGSGSAAAVESGMRCGVVCRVRRVERNENEVGFRWTFICDARRFPAVQSRGINVHDDSGQAGRAGPCLCTAGRPGHTPCLPGHRVFGPCWACLMGCQPSPSTTRLMLQAGPGLIVVVLGRVRARPNLAGLMPAHLWQAKFLGISTWE